MHGRRLHLSRPLDRGLLSRARVELRAVVPAGCAPIRPIVRVHVTENAATATALVRWKVGAKVVGLVTTVTQRAKDQRGAKDLGNVALAYLLGRLERTRTGTTGPLDPKVVAELERPARRTAKTGSTKTERKAKPAKKPVARVGGQLARGLDRALLTEVAQLSSARLPKGAVETGRTLDVFAIRSGVFRASLRVSFRTARGRRDQLRVDNMGHGPQTKHEALATLVALLQKVPQSAKR